ncbi:segregation and condensation protein A [Parasporobacterium paucivorans]|uniref:Segregation and condensation protein A n=1 Tax=Parasporobacterium paucivorans DSM 15970 TaxID=1122934 RepID=A0A1M6F7B1_9FIRM|nr:segregation/condensation protein A [Parasporobacterium paucivorans]SHI93585.1 condensin subunit ScpA [Parasporobacterium paucivorans DSM 15970]
MALSVKLEAFEGPLNLLLHLIERNKVNIYDIPIVEITNQYLAYIGSMEKKDLNIMSEFLVMAATLLDIKSRMLLPKEEETEETDPRAELVEQLLEYKMFKCVSSELRNRQTQAQKTYYKEPSIPEEVKSYEPPVDLDKLMDKLTLDKLSEIYSQVLRRQSNKVDTVRSGFGRIEKDEVTIDDKIKEILCFTNNHTKFSFRKFLSRQSGKSHLIVSFLAILELIKTGKISAVQEQVFDDIIISAA